MGLLAPVLAQFGRIPQQHQSILVPPDLYARPGNQVGHPVLFLLELHYKLN